jgi:hypothetical protein
VADPSGGWQAPDTATPPAQPPFAPPAGTWAYGSAPGGGYYGPYYPPAPPKKSRLGLIISIVAVVLALGVGGAFYFANRKSGYPGGFFSPGVTDAKVGDCLPASVADDTSDISQTETVDCTSADAKYRVVGVVDNQDEPSADSTVFETVCQPFNATVGLWVGPSNGTGGKIYCLTDM